MPCELKKIQELERYPKFAENYKRAIARFLPKYLERRKAKGATPCFTTVDDWYRWWIEDKEVEKDLPLLDFLEEDW